MNDPSQRHQEIDALLASLGFSTPKEYSLYERALTHSSFSYEYKLSPLENYERLEFLGDAVLKLVVSRYLFHRFPEYREGELTKIRSVIVSDAILADLASDFHLGDYMVFGGSEAKSGGRKKPSNLACGFEALLGALYLDGKISEIHPFLTNILEELVTHVDLSKTKYNYKAALQELTQAENGILPSYKTVQESGPSHNKTFHVEVWVNGEAVGYGSGKSKKEAQQNAARVALETLNYPEENS